VHRKPGPAAPPRKGKAYERRSSSSGRPTAQLRRLWACNSSELRRDALRGNRTGMGGLAGRLKKDSSNNMHSGALKMSLTWCSAALDSGVFERHPADTPSAGAWLLRRSPAPHLLRSSRVDEFKLMAWTVTR